MILIESSKSDFWYWPSVLN